MPEIASQSSRAFTGQTTPRAYTIVGLDRYGCATRRSKGTCTNALLIGRQAIEERVLGGLRFRADCVFHSIRKTVATMFKDASVPEATAADILGHEIATMSYGVYAATSRSRRSATQSRNLPTRRSQSPKTRAMLTIVSFRTMSGLR